MKQFSVKFSFIFLFVSVQSCQLLADIFITTDKNIRIEVIDYNDSLNDVLFWLYQSKDTPVLPQKLISSGIYPISVTIFNGSDKTIKIMKNAIGGLSTAQEQEVAQLYQYDAFAYVIKKVVIAAAGFFLVIELLNQLTEYSSVLAAWKRSLITDADADYDSCYAYYRNFLSLGGGAYAALVHAPAITMANSLVSQAFQSQVLPNESLIAPGCSMSFLLFASHSPSGYTLKVPILDEQSNQVTSFVCPFDVVTTAT